MRLRDAAETTGAATSILITKVLDRGRVVVRRKQDKPLTVVHVDCLKAYRGAAVPTWMRAEQRGCVAV